MRSIKWKSLGEKLWVMNINVAVNKKDHMHMDTNP